MRYRTVLWNLIRALPWAAAALVSAGSYWVLLFVNSKPESWYGAGLSKDNFVRIAASIFASALFFILIQFLLALKSSQRETEHTYFESMYLKHGIQNAFGQRGGEEALATYNGALRDASKRIWAMGLSCRGFLNHHMDALRTALSSRPEIDVKIFFADPDCHLTSNGSDLSIMDLQRHLEEKTEADADWQTVIRDAISRLQVLPIGPGTGMLSVYLVISACFFTCLVIDDRVFFFPMLARAASSQDPTIQVSAESALGKSVIEHLTGLTRFEKYCACVYNNHAEKPILMVGN